MTPQERQLIDALFDRLATLEGQRRDADAERAIADGFDRAPNAAYPLVQTVLVQDEALKRANARIEELEAAHTAEPQPAGGSFLDTMRNTVLGHDAPRGSVPSVRGSGMGTSGVWNSNREGGWGARPDSAAPMAAPPPAYGGGGGSFLGTAAASAAGVIGGAMLLNGIRSMFGPSHGGVGSSAFDPGASGGHSPWSGGGSDSDLARDAGLNDIGGSRGGTSDQGRHAGLFGGDDNAADDSDAGSLDDDAGGFDGGDTDSA